MSKQKSDIHINEFNPSHIGTYTDALLTFTEQLYIHNSLIEKVLSNTEGNPEHHKLLREQHKLIKELVLHGEKQVKFIENKDGLDAIVSAAHGDTQASIVAMKQGLKESIKELGNSITLRVALILAGAGLFFNVVMFWIQKYVVSPELYEHLTPEQMALLLKLLEEVKNAAGN